MMGALGWRLLPEWGSDGGRHHDTSSVAVPGLLRCCWDRGCQGMEGGSSCTPVCVAKRGSG